MTEREAYIYAKYLVPATEELFGRPVTRGSEILAMLGASTIVMLRDSTQKQRKVWLRELTTRLEGNS